jgi:hypothetical protein
MLVFLLVAVCRENSWRRILIKKNPEHTKVLRIILRSAYGFQSFSRADKNIRFFSEKKMLQKGEQACQLFLLLLRLIQERT